MDVPVLVYDGGCGFCIQNVKFLEKLPLRFSKRSFRDPGFFEDYPKLSPIICEKEVTLVMPDGALFFGAEAFFKLISEVRYLKWALGFYRLPGVKRIFDTLYRNVSTYRFHLRYWE